MSRTLFCLLVAFALLTSSLAPPAFAQRSLLGTLYMSGVKAYEKGDYKDALRIFRECEKMQQTTKLTPAENAGMAYSTAEALRCIGQLNEAEANYKKSLAIVDTLPPKLRDYNYLFNGLALLYQTQGKFSEAESLYKQSETSAGKNALRASYPVCNLARLYFQWGKLKEETEYVTKGEQYAKKLPKALALPYYQYNLAQLNEQKGLYKEADEQYKKSLVTGAEMFSASHPYVGVTLTGQSDLYRKLSRYQDAEDCLQRVLKIYSDRYTSEHPDVVETKVRLARVLAEEGKYKQARELVQEAMKTQQSAYGAGDNLTVAKAQNCLGNIYRQYGNYQESQHALEQALELEKRILGSDNVEVAVTMRDLAMALQDQANFDEAESLLKSSMTIIESKTGPDHPERAAAANALAHAYLRNEKYADAEPLLKKALELSAAVLGAVHIVTASSARDLAALYLKQKQFPEAEKYLAQTLSIDEQLFGVKSPQVAADLLSLADVYGLQGQPAKAAPMLKRAAEIKNVLPGGGVSVEEIASVPLAAGNDRPISDKWALIVGISNFKDSSINLKYAAKDATDFKNFLVNSQRFRADHVKLLTDEGATRENIIGMLGEKWLQSHVKADDLVVIYVSSHGSPATSATGGTNFLVAHDTNKNSLAATGIPMQWLTQIVADQVKSNRVILLLDVCHSGAAGQKGLTRAGVDARSMSVGNGQMIICSSLADQSSWESRNYENGVFTRRLMEALLNNKDQTTLTEAYKQLKVLVEAEVLRDRGELQTPLLVNKKWTGKDPNLSATPTHVK